MSFHVIYCYNKLKPRFVYYKMLPTSQSDSISFLQFEKLNFLNEKKNISDINDFYNLLKLDISYLNYIHTCKRFHCMIVKKSRGEKTIKIRTIFNKTENIYKGMITHFSIENFMKKNDLGKFHNYIKLLHV